MPERVAKGEKITITHHSIRAAALVPVAQTEAKLSDKDIVEGVRALRERVKPRDMSVKVLIAEGHRHALRLPRWVMPPKRILYSHKALIRIYR